MCNWRGKSPFGPSLNTSLIPVVLPYDGNGRVSALLPRQYEFGGTIGTGNETRTADRSAGVDAAFTRRLDYGVADGGIAWASAPISQTAIARFPCFGRFFCHIISPRLCRVNGDTDIATSRVC